MAGAGAPSRARAGTVAIDSIPLFPLNTVLFPGGRLPLRIFEQRYMQALLELLDARARIERLRAMIRPAPED